MLSNFIWLNTCRTMFPTKTKLKIERLTGRILTGEIVACLVVFLISALIFKFIMNFIFGIPEINKFIFYPIFIVPFIYGICNIYKFATSTKGRSFGLDKDESVILVDNTEVGKLAGISKVEIVKIKSFGFYSPFKLSVNLIDGQVLDVHQSTNHNELKSLRRQINLFLDLPKEKL